MLLIAASPALADAKGAGTHFAAPYAGASTRIQNTCLAGSICTPVANADSSGRVTATVDISRTSNDQASKESAQGIGEYACSLRAPRGATKLSAKITWLVGSANSSAAATHGQVITGGYLSGRAQCGSRTVTTDFKEFAVSGANEAGPASASA